MVSVALACSLAAIAAGGVLSAVGAPAGTPASDAVAATMAADAPRATPAAGAPRVTPAAGAPRATPAAGGVAKMIWGPVVLPNGQSAFPIYHELGVNVFQIDLSWAQAAPTRPIDARDPTEPAYRWPAELDQALQQAAFYGIRVCLLVQGTPSWANGGRSSKWAPNDPADYGQFLIAAARRYPSVRDWMIWGEPNRNGNFEPMPADSPVGPRRYALLLDAAYRALKQVSSADVVIGGNTWSFGTVEPASFLRWMRLPDGNPPPLDDYGHNPFSIRFPDLREPPYYPGGRDIDDIDTLEAQLASTYHRQVKLWLSEFTVSSDHDNRAFAFHVTRKQQARWLTAAFALASSVDYVAGLGWYDLLDEPPSAPGQLTQGLMSWNLKPKPAFSAYEHAR
jgi:hypothetical protein